VLHDLVPFPDLPGTVSELADTWNEFLSRGATPTASYVYSRDLVLRNWGALNSALQPLCEVLVSLKANPNAVLLQDLAAAGASFDVASPAEIRAARRALSLAGSHSSISLVGPGKSALLLRAAVRSSVDVICVESTDEILRLAEVVSRMPSGGLNVSLRVNPSNPGGDSNEVMGGAPTQFGIDQSEIARALQTSQHLPHTNGLHFFIGSGFATIEEFQTSIHTSVTATEAIAAENRFYPERVNLGGGLGVPHFSGDEPISLEAVSTVIAAAGDSLATILKSRPLLTLEAGRYVFGNAGVFVCTVLEVKRSKGRAFVIVDCGITGFSRPIVHWGQQHPIWKLGDPYLTEGSSEFSVVGPTCLPGDILGSRVFLDDVQPGDRLLVGNAGAYGYTMSLTNWGSLNRVREVAL
jgi:diaminopimelate decarboxylase